MFTWPVTLKEKGEKMLHEERSWRRRITGKEERFRSRVPSETWKRSFISTVRPTVHTNPSRKRSSNRRNLKTPALRFSVDGNILKTELFENDGVTIIMWFPWPIFLKHKSKMTSDCCVFKFLRRSLDGKHLMRFQSEKAVSKFFRPA